MGKEGPCYHCGVTSTPLWRNGPPEKPVLCNACGSRWRTKGTLTNYAPLHSRAVADEYEEPRVSKVKTLSLKERDGKLKKRKLSYENSVVKRPASNYNQDFLKITYEDTSNRSSSGSAVSNSESCAHFTSADASDLTGLAQSAAWESQQALQQAPSKKRTCVIRTKSSPVEKLIKDLHAILHEQESSCVSGFSEEELLFESDEPMVSVEIGHGSVLIKHPSSLVREEESEATSFSLENKSSAVNDAYSCAASFDKLNYLKGDSVSYHGSENVSKLTGQQMHEELAKREMQKQLFWTHDSPLCYIDLNEVINFEVLLGHLTIDEQHQLLKYLPSSDAYQFPQSLQETFDSDCFKENLSYFQELLSEGVFSSSSTGVKSEDFRTLKKLALSNLTKSKWLGLYRKLKDSRSNHDARESPISSGSKLSLLKDLGRSKRPLLDQNKHMLDKETTIRGSKRGLFKSSLETKEPLESDRSLFTQGNQFGLLTDGVESFYLPDESSDQDLLLDVPSNASFPEAELLLPTSSFQISASSSYTHPGMINH